MSAHDSSAFARAYAVHPRTGELHPPAVRIVDLSSNGRGNALFSNRPIPKGTVIYTERAACCTVVSETNGASSAQPKSCHNCFRSLEQIPSSTSTGNWPHPYLWPSLTASRKPTTLAFDDDTTGSVSIDALGRIQCTHCHELFCSLACYKQSNPTAFCCCQLSAVMESVNQLYRSAQQQPQAAVLLAIRMFTRLVQEQRKENDGATSRKDELKPQDCTVLEGLCGDASEVQALELGLHERLQSDEEGTLTYVFRLEPVYHALVKGLALEQQQQRTFTLNLLQQCAAQAARNGFAFRTQSPFDTYYASVLRVAGRGSPAHEQLKTTIAHFLEQQDGKEGSSPQTATASTSGTAPVLQRGMEQQMQQRFTPDLCALFALTARINHSCSSNAQVQAQTFVDATMDLIATQDIPADTEITISYLPPHSTRQRTSTRQKQLQARYLFRCACPLCCNSTVTTTASA